MAEVQIVFANGKHPGETAGHTSRDRVSFATRRGSCRLRSNLKPQASSAHLRPLRFGSPNSRIIWVATALTEYLASTLALVQPILYFYDHNRAGCDA